MDPSQLTRSGYDSIISSTVYKHGTVYAMPHPSHLLPRFLLQFKKSGNLWDVAKKASTLEELRFHTTPPYGIIVI
jgi:hypothetical protein